MRKDCNTHGERLLFYVNENLSCIVLKKYPMHQDLEFIFPEMKLSKTKLLIVTGNSYLLLLVIGTYKPASVQ